MEQFKHLNLDDILNKYTGYQLTDKTINKINEDYKQKELDWMNSERMD